MTDRPGFFYQNDYAAGADSFFELSDSACCLDVFSEPAGKDFMQNSERTSADSGTDCFSGMSRKKLLHRIHDGSR